MILRAKSKTFLVGEYCVTCGGSAIVLCTFPNFVLRVMKGYGIIRGIRDSSPAFAFYERYQNVFQYSFVQFIDPHSRTGGFGASSAQFSMLYRLKEKIEKSFRKEDVLSVGYTARFLNEYHSITQCMGKYGYHASRIPSLITPSGADCLAQLHNCNIYFNSSTNEVERLVYWPFEDLDFVIIKTGQKLPTYKHLCQLSPGFIRNSAVKLSSIVEEVRVAWKKSDSQKFVQEVRNFAHALEDLELVALRTQEILLEVRKLDGVMAAKGCGAMGADTVIIIFEKHKKEEVMIGIEEIEKKIIFRN